jgi:sarcosine oxidase subunit gamma
MPEHAGFELSSIEGRSMVRLRVRPAGADAACLALDIPQQAVQCTSGDPAAFWLGPDQWLLSSDTQSVQEMIGHIDKAMTGQLYAATDMSSHNACFSLKGRAARIVLAMGCGIDVHESAFKVGDCVRTRFANVPLLVAVIEDECFDLYVDRSHAEYLKGWIEKSGEDPITWNTRQQK